MSEKINRSNWFEDTFIYKVILTGYNTVLGRDETKTMLFGVPLSLSSSMIQEAEKMALEYFDDHYEEILIISIELMPHIAFRVEDILNEMEYE